ncbi:MAG: hypothetical protein M1831_006477 [Alyxoria varia]|nr:MAG: hypothetical protein M1831_006477 [Alyxoria varia]
MAGNEIQSSVSSINAAFVSVRDFLTSLGRSNPRSGPKAKQQRVNEGARLKKSLTGTPKAIEAEYARGVAAQGKRFQKGDVNVIASFLKEDKKTKNKPSIDYPALAVLADSCKIDACCCLRELRTRLTSREKNQPPLSSIRSDDKERAPRKPTEIVTSKGVTHGSKIRASRQTQWVVVRSRPRESRKHSSSPSSSAGSKTLVEAGSNGLASADPRATSEERLPTTQTSQWNYTLPHHYTISRRHDTVDETRKLQRLDPERSLHVGPSNYGPDFRVQRPQVGVSRQRTQRTINSLHSFASDSTKLGEIPLHRYAYTGDMEEEGRANEAHGFQQSATNLTGNTNRTTVKPNFISRFLRLASSKRG